MPHPSCRQICAPAPRRLSARLARRRRRRRHSRRRRLPALRPRLTAAVSPPINQNHCVNWHLVMHRFPTTDDIATATGSYILHLPCRRHRPPPFQCLHTPRPQLMLRTVATAVRPSGRLADRPSHFALSAQSPPCRRLHQGRARRPPAVPQSSPVNNHSRRFQS